MYQSHALIQFDWVLKYVAPSKVQTHYSVKSDLNIGIIHSTKSGQSLNCAEL